MMRVLILGGTVFLGRHLVEAAQARGHQVTLFNRGQHNADLFPEVEKLRGDRDGGLDVLRGRRWDAAVDTCGYVPRLVRDATTVLADAVDHYTFISSISVFRDFKVVGMDESAPVATLDDPTVEEVTGEAYGALKALCEQAAEVAMPGRVLVVRPGLIVGPHDPTDRFTYWPARVAAGGEVLAPGSPDWPVQFIDVRDLAEWTIRLIESRATGIYNATGPDYRLGMGPFLEACIAVSGANARLTWVGEEYLLGAGVAPWSDLPLWVPEGEDYAGFARVDCGKAIAAGLTFRPLAQTIRDTLAWDAARPHDDPPRAGISREREAELLRGWHERE
jgi:2'-hydroxyisoflavone reductase